jgi:hypothetical protein
MSVYQDWQRERDDAIECLEDAVDHLRDSLNDAKDSPEPASQSYRTEMRKASIEILDIIDKLN